MGQRTKRVHVLSAANAGQVSKEGGIYTIRDVCIAVDDIVMNSMLYPGDQLAAGAPTMSGKPAPAGHPKNADGQFISATNGDALLTAYMGGICTNARHVGGRTLVDIKVNEAQARAHADGAELCDRLDAAIAGQSMEPIHVSSGLTCVAVNAAGENARGKRYDRIATAINYDHTAILLHQRGAGTPDDGVGMFLNADGAQWEVERAVLNAMPEDRRGEGVERFKSWIRKLLGNESDMTFDQIAEGLSKLLPNGSWLREVFAKSVVWTDESGRLWRQGYEIGADGVSVSLQGEPVEVVRRVDYQPVTNSQEKDVYKEMILAALNAAGVPVEGKAEAELYAAHNQLVAANAVKPVQQQLDAVNAENKQFKDAAAAADAAKRDALVAKLATNAAGLTADELKLLPVATLEKMVGNTQAAAPILTGNNQGGKASEFASYDLNAVNGIKE